MQQIQREINIFSTHETTLNTLIGCFSYQKLWKHYVKFKHLLANKPKVTEADKRKLLAQEDQLQDMRMRRYG